MSRWHYRFVLLLRLLTLLIVAQHGDIWSADTAPRITVQPKGEVIHAGSDFTIFCEVEGLQPQHEVGWWRKNYYDSAWSAVPGQSGLVLKLTNLTPQITDYVLRVHLYGRLIAESEPARLQVLTPPILVSSPIPSSLGVYTGDPLSWKIEGQGLLGSSYQWLRDGAPISGAISHSFSIQQVASEHVGLYSVSASNAFGQALSPAATFPLILTNAIREGIFSTNTGSEIAASELSFSPDGSLVMVAAADEGRGALLAAVTPEGKPLWSLRKLGKNMVYDWQLPGMGFDDVGNGYFIFRRDFVPEHAFLQKLTPDGLWEWTNSLTIPWPVFAFPSAPRAMVLVASNGPIFTSFATLCAFDPDGTKLWERSITNHLIALKSDGGVYGETLNRMTCFNADGTTNWSVSPPFSVQTFDAKPDGGLFVVGLTNVQQTVSALVCARYSRDGKLEWIRMLPQRAYWDRTVRYSQLRCVALGKGLAIFSDDAGAYPSGHFLWHVDDDGRPQWRKSYFSDARVSVWPHEDGLFLSFRSYGSEPSFLSKIDYEGTTRWKMLLGDPATVALRGDGTAYALSAQKQTLKLEMISDRETDEMRTAKLRVRRAEDSPDGSVHAIVGDKVARRVLWKTGNVVRSSAVTYMPVASSVAEVATENQVFTSPEIDILRSTLAPTLNTKSEPVVQLKSARGTFWILQGSTNLHDWIDIQPMVDYPLRLPSASTNKESGARFYRTRLP